eukprot:gnl/MRDRNA2_/MRDRNA2_110326_c0_seq1.p1 gnl/MRDRNA2_/MRDRNA2_110326_c0~~gnl/MRDRNA2_/MRDRNA2_110326_c0_seq1.p1  ORF type:complete len:464 (-),score=89.76 gnl/MRDRNA2_/MRDRNA2_110326_c0_seq1:3-1394(-)
MKVVTAPPAHLADLDSSVPTSTGPDNECDVSCGTSVASDVDNMSTTAPAQDSAGSFRSVEDDETIENGSEDEQESLIYNDTLNNLAQIKATMESHRRQVSEFRMDNADNTKSIQNMSDQFQDIFKELVDAVETMAGTFARRERRWEARLQSQRLKRKHFEDDNKWIKEEIERFRLRPVNARAGLINDVDRELPPDKCRTPSMPSPIAMPDNKTTPAGGHASSRPTKFNAGGRQLTPLAILQQKLLQNNGHSLDNCESQPFSNPSLRWSSSGAGSRISVLSGGSCRTHARYSYDPRGGDKASSLQGYAVTEEPLPEVDQGWLGFAMCIERLNHDYDDGLAVGVTQQTPEAWQAGRKENKMHAADAMPDTWLAGYEGNFFEASTREWKSLEWNPVGLRVGDVLMLRVSVELQRFQIYVNGKGPVVDHHCQFPQNDARPIHGVVELMGTADEVKLLRPDKARFSNS